MVWSGSSWIEKERWLTKGPAPNTLGAGSSPWSGTHHDTLPLRGHQDETLREDRVPRCLPGGPSECLPRADDPPLEVLRRLAEWGGWSRLWPNKYGNKLMFLVE